MDPYTQYMMEQQYLHEQYMYQQHLQNMGSPVSQLSPSHYNFPDMSQIQSFPVLSREQQLSPVNHILHREQQPSPVNHFVQREQSYPVNHVLQREQQPSPVYHDEPKEIVASPTRFREQQSFPVHHVKPREMKTYPNVYAPKTNGYEDGKRCGAFGCLRNHTKHFCVHCNTKDSKHTFRDCPNHPKDIPNRDKGVCSICKSSEQNHDSRECFLNK